VITALASCDAPAVLVVACDVPYLTVGTVRALLERPGAEHVAVAVTDRLEPMCALWLRTALGQVRGIFAGGERRLFAVLDQLDSRQVPVNPQDLANVNAPGDLPQ